MHNRLLLLLRVVLYVGSEVFKTEILNYKDQGLMVEEKHFDFMPNDQTVELLQAHSKDKSVIGVLDTACRDPMNKG